MKVRRRRAPAPAPVPFLQSIRRLRLAKGDILLLQCPPGTRSEEAHRCAHGLQRVLDLAGHASQPVLLMPSNYNLLRLSVEQLAGFRDRITEVLAMAEEPSRPEGGE